MSLVAGTDIDVFAECLAVTGLNGPTINHDGWAVVARKRHNDAWHVLIAAGYCDTCIVVLRTGHGFDTISNDLAGLEGKAHSCVHEYGGNWQASNEKSAYPLHP